MAIFGVLDVEGIVQVDDKTRLKGTRSFVSKGEAAITLVEIEPESGDGFITVTGSSLKDWYLDWAYSGTNRTVTVSLRITTDGSPVTFTKSIDVKISAAEKLFSNDNDLMRVETNIMNWLPDGHSSFIYAHRKSQQLILDWFNEMGYRAYDATKITVDEVLDNDEVRKWSEMITLSLIYNDLSNSVGDMFSIKSDMYKSKAADAKNRSIFSLDLDKDGVISTGEGVCISSINLVNR